MYGVFYDQNVYIEFIQNEFQIYTLDKSLLLLEGLYKIKDQQIILNPAHPFQDTYKTEIILNHQVIK